MKGIIEIGNMVYIPIELDGLPCDNIVEIFKQIEVWQTNNQNKEIIDVQYLWTQETFCTTDYTRGVSFLWKNKA